MTPFTLRSRASRVLTALLALASSGVAACSSPPAIDQQEPVTLRVLMTDDWGDRPAFLAAVKDFEQRHRTVRVAIDRLPIRNMADAVRGLIEDRNPPDVVQWHAYAAGAQGMAEPVEDLWRKAGMKTSEFFPGAVDDVRWAGHLYGVPLDINALVLFFRPEPFASASLQPPGQTTTFVDLERYGPVLSSPDGFRRVLAVPNSYWAAYGWVRANGGELVRLSGGKPQFTLDSPEVVEALAFLSRMVKQGHAFAPIGATSSADALALFRAGSSVIHASGSWDLAKLDREATGAHYGTAPMPAGTTGRTRGSVTGGSSLFVAKGAGNRELAFEFMRTITSDQHALRLAKEERRLPVRPRLYDDPFFDDSALEVVRQQLETARPLTIEAFPEAAKAWETAFIDVMERGADPASALRIAQEKAEGSAAGGSE